MSQFQPALKYQVQEMIYDAVNLLDENNFYHQRQGAPSELTRKLTYMLGDMNKQYPLSTMTLGGIGYSKENFESSAKELDDVQFTYPVMGRRFKPSQVAKTDYTSIDKPGIGHSEFFIYFFDQWIKRYWTIQSAGGITAYVLEDPERQPDGTYKYKCQLNPAADTDYCPPSELDYGASWIGMTTNVPESQSRSTDSNMVMPGLWKNQMGFHRHGMSWAGNSANKVMKFNLKSSNGVETEMWMDWFMYQFEQEWLDICENAYWYSRYNRRADGTIPLKDLITGKVIPTASGVLEQIQNKSSYASLTYNNLMNFVGDSLYGQSDTDNMVIDLWTGKGGLREMDRAMKLEGKSFLSDWGFVADKFVSGSGGRQHDLMLGGFFSGFYHIDGYTIRVKYNPVYDHGRVAVNQQAGGRVHPETGFPLESYRMTFIDSSDYDGQPNIQHVCQKKRAYLHGVVKGLTDMPRSLELLLGNGTNVSNMLATDVDQASYTRFRSQGIQILRANRCFDLICTAG
jgi:hypothetical protein